VRSHVRGSPGVGSAEEIRYLPQYRTRQFARCGKEKHARKQGTECPSLQSVNMQVRPNEALLSNLVHKTRGSDDDWLKEHLPNCARVHLESNARSRKRGAIMGRKPR